MACVAPELLQGFVAGSLSEADVDAVEDHVDSCADCRAALGELAATSAITADTEVDVEMRAARASSSSIIPGIQIGRYIVLRKIGEGGMGVVALARDPELRRKVVIKLVRPEHVDPDDTLATRARLQREAQAMARLSHPNVVSIYDVGTHRDQVFIAMEFVDGANLARWLTALPRKPAEIVSVFVQAGRGLAAAHEAQLVHRDFKPHNVMIGRGGVVKVTDFGLAAQRLETATPAGSDIVLDELTRTGALMGTPAYMAPEQLLGDDVDARADQFSFCVALWQALYGSRPFAGDTVPTLLEAIHDGVTDEPKLVAGKRVHAALVRGLSSEPAKRFPNMPALLAELTPKSRAVPLAAGASALVATTAIAIAVLRPDSAGDGPCDADTLADVWTPSARAAITNARAAADLDGYASAWRAARKQVCVTGKALHIPEDKDRVACLDRARLELRRVVETAPGRDAVAGLRALDACGDPAPHDPILAVSVNMLRLGIEAVDHDASGIQFDVAEARARGIVAVARALHYPPIEAEGLIALGQVQMQRAEWEPASATMIEAIQVADEGHHDRARGEAQLALVPIFRALGRADEADRYKRYALASLHDAVSYATSQLKLANALGDSFERQGRLADSIAQRDEEIELAKTIDDRTLTAALVDKGRTLRHANHYAEALPVLEQARDVGRKAKLAGDEVFAARVGILECLKSLDRIDEAIAEANEMIADGNVDPAVHVWLAQLYAEKGDADKAIEHANAQLDGKPVGSGDWIESLGVRGITYYRVGRYTEAEADLRQVVERGPGVMAPEDVVTLRNALATVIAKQGRYDEAVALFAIDVSALDASADPNQPLLANTLVRQADALVRSGKPADAIAAATRARSLIADGSPSDLALAAWVLARATPDRGKAVAYAREARRGYEQAHDKDKIAEIDKWLRE